jgi:16S rRNA (adenine1518-N6/adenine1519-N6)-dimethyltransferase
MTMSIKSTLDARGLRPQKKWGQHFLTDARILGSIADAAEVAPTDTILEIGPGLGHLTRVLAQRAGRVVAIEIDAQLAHNLQNEFAEAPNVSIVRGDILDKEPSVWLANAGAPSADFKIVANLPYYVTSAILRHVLEAANKPRIIVVMVQREVAQRMVARPPAMNLLAVSVQFFAQPRIVRTIAAGAFFPPPKVDSAVVRLDVFAQPRLAQTADFFRVVRAGFGEKRKQLRNSLAHGLARDATEIHAALASVNIESTRRAETLTLDEWDKLYRALIKFDKGQ